MVQALAELASSMLIDGGDPAEALELIEEAEQIANLHRDDMPTALSGLAAQRQKGETALKKAPKK